MANAHSPRCNPARAALLAAMALCAGTSAVAAPPPLPAIDPSYADLATLADGAPIAVRVKITAQAVVPAERAPGLAPGQARLYLESQTLSLLAGTTALPESLRYLADVPLDAKGRPPKLKKREFILFARPVPGRPGELQLTGPSAQIAYTPALEARLRPVLTALVASDAPPRVTGVRDALSRPGNLAGESETQVFLATASGEPAALTIVRRPGMAPRWGVSWSELVDQSAAPPQTQTIAWFRLACGLPGALPATANAAADPADKARAAQDYRFVLDQLGPCERKLGGNPA